MPSKPVVYMDSRRFIDAVKHDVGSLPAERDDDVLYIEKLLEAHRAGHVEVRASILFLAECVSVETGQSSVPERDQKLFRRLLLSGQFLTLTQTTPRTGMLAQELRWKHGIVLQGPDALHIATALECKAREFITTDDQLRKPKLVAARPILGGLGLRLIRGYKSESLPSSYFQGDMLDGKK